MSNRSKSAKGNNRGERPTYQKVLITIVFVLIAVIGVMLVWLFAPLTLQNKILVSGVILLGVNLISFAVIHWKKRVFQTVIMSIISLAMAGVILVSTVFWGDFVNNFYNYDAEFPEKEEELEAVPIIDEKIINIALFGIDTRKVDSFSGNSDSIMILSLNKKERTVKLISIMRDTLVPMQHKGKTIYHKINSAYARGGPELAVRTINSVFGLDITEYVTVNFFGMSKIIDAVGGIEVELTELEAKKGINPCIEEICRITGEDPKPHYIKSSGKQHLNGIQAVAYSRIRYYPNIWGTNNDYGRTDRQRYVMEQLFNKALNINKRQYPALVKALLPYTITSLSPDEILNLAFSMLTKSPTFLQERIPHQDYLMKSPSGSFGSVVYYDLDFAGKLIHEYIYNDIKFEDYIKTNGISKNDWYANR